MLTSARVRSVLSASFGQVTPPSRCPRSLHFGRIQEPVQAHLLSTSIMFTGHLLRQATPGSPFKNGYTIFDSIFLHLLVYLISFCLCYFFDS